MSSLYLNKHAELDFLQSRDRDVASFGHCILTPRQSVLFLGKQFFFSEKKNLSAKFLQNKMPPKIQIDPLVFRTPIY